MQYTSHYQSPLGRILLAADNTGLTGLWFEGQKYFALSLNAKCLDRETPLLANAKRWLDLYFTGKIRISLSLCTLWEPNSKKRSGKFSAQSLTGKRLLMETSHVRLPEKEVWIICPPRLLAVPWDTIRFLSLYHATVSSERTAA